MTPTSVLAAGLLLGAASLLLTGAPDRAAPAPIITALAAAPLALEPAIRQAYGNDKSQFGDLRLPATPSPAPVVVVLHGGCWQAALASLDNTEALAEALRREGYVTWNVEYRRLGEPGAGWPGTFRDVGTALDYLRVLAKRYPDRLDTTRVVVVGHSAGGHLASWLATRPQLPADWMTFPAATRVDSKSTAARRVTVPLRPTGIVNLDGPPDLRAFEAADTLLCGRGICTKLLGGTALQHFDRWRLASPSSFLPWKVPCRMVVGSDGMMTNELCQDFVTRAAAAGDTATELVELALIDHFALIDPKSKAWPAVREAVREMARPE